MGIELEAAPSAPLRLESKILPTCREARGESRGALRPGYDDRNVVRTRQKRIRSVTMRALRRDRTRARISGSAGTWAAIFFACVLILTASGRVGSGDAGAGLQASMLFATTGSFGTSTLSPGLESPLFVKSPSGRYYECHDLGNHLLLLPAALLGRFASHRSAESLVTQPPLGSRVAVSFTMALFSALAAWFVFKTLRLLRPTKTAFVLACGFVFTTIFWVYSKTAWDVVGTACCVAPCLYYGARAIAGIRPERSYYAAAAWAAGAATFRFSTGPFLALALALVAVLVPQLRRPRTLATAAGIFVALLIPEFIYNQVRMGSPIQPPTTAPQFTRPGGGNDFGGDPVVGYLGLFFAPNKGLFLFSPVFLLGLALPWYWSRLGGLARRILIAFGPAALLYLVLIACLRRWGGNFGWGPRYIVPVLPILFLPTALIAEQIWRSRHRWLLIALVGVSFLSALGPVLVNWNLVSAQDASIVSQTSPVPREQAEIWKNFARGVVGKPVALPAGVDPGSIRAQGARFPDLWLMRVAERRRIFIPPVVILALALLAAAVLAVRRIRHLTGDAPAANAAAKPVGAL